MSNKSKVARIEGVASAINFVETPASSVIARFCYDAGQQVLTIEFKHGGVYNYHGVPESIFEEMSVAGSAGQFFAASIRDVYPFTRNR